MSEEPGTPEPITPEVTPETTPTETPQSFIDGTGNFTKGWENAYLTEDQKDNARVTSGRITSVQGMLDTIANSDKMISGDKILKPSDSSGDAEWEEYHKAGGWTGEVIPMAAPEGLPEGLWSEERGTAFSTLFNDLKLSPAQQAGIVEAYNADLLSQVNNNSMNTETSNKETKAELLAEKGNSYNQFMHNGDFAVEKGMDDADHKQRVIDKFGTDVDFIRLMGNLGGGMNEAGSIPTGTMTSSPADLQTQINDLMSSDAFMKPMHPEHKTTMATIARLHEEKANTVVPT
jgi:hypothetical protein